MRLAIFFAYLLASPVMANELPLWQPAPNSFYACRSDVALGTQIGQLVRTSSKEPTEDCQVVANDDIVARAASFIAPFGCRGERHWIITFKIVVTASDKTVWLVLTDLQWSEQIPLSNCLAL